MERCSYTWKEFVGETAVIVTKQCPEKIWEGSDEYCIFHDQSPEKDIELFRQKLMEKLERKDYNFEKYYFPEKVGNF